MDHPIQSISRHLFDPSCRTRGLKPLVVADPLWVYVVAKALELEQLEERSGARTFAAGAYDMSLSREVGELNTELYMEPLEMRRIRA